MPGMKKADKAANKAANKAAKKAAKTDLQRGARAAARSAANKATTMRSTSKKKKKSPSQRSMSTTAKKKSTSTKKKRSTSTKRKVKKTTTKIIDQDQDEDEDEDTNDMFGSVLQKQQFQQQNSNMSGSSLQQDQWKHQQQSSTSFVHNGQIHLVLSLLAYGAIVFYTVGPHAMIEVTPMQWYVTLSLTTAGLFSTAYVSTCNDSLTRTLALIVCFCYMHRAIFMHCTVERDCFWDMVLCCSLWGRTIACTGEMTFVYMSVKQLAPSKTTLVVSMIAVAQTISFIGVMKRHYGWFFFENSIWTICAFGLAIHVYLYNSKRQFQAVPYLLLAFVFYNCYEDLPMYIARNAEKTYLPGYNLGIIEGALDALKCKQVSQSAEMWNPQMLWQTLNYTIVPAAVIGLMGTAEKEKGKKKDNYKNSLANLGLRQPSLEDGAGKRIAGSARWYGEKFMPWF